MPASNVPTTDIDMYPEWVFVDILRVSKSKLVPRENDLCQAHNSKFLEVNHSWRALEGYGLNLNFIPTAML